MTQVKLNILVLVVAGLALASDGPSAVAQEKTASHTVTLRTRITTEAVFAVAWSPDSKTLASANAFAVTLWDPATGKKKAAFKSKGGLPLRVNAVSWSPDGKTLASASQDAMVRLWDVTTGTVAICKGHKSSVESVTWSPDSKTLASGAGDGTIKLWDAATGTETATFKGHEEREFLCCVSWSPDGKTLASANERFDGNVKLWDTTTLKVQATFTGNSHVRTVSWSRDSKTLAASGDVCILWDLAAGKERMTLKGIKGGVHWVSWRPDGKTVATAHGFESSVKLWDAATGKVQATLEGATNVWFVSWSPDGTTLAAVGDDTVYVWDVSHRK